MQVLGRELRANRKSLWIWIVSLSALCLLTMSVYPSLKQDVRGTEALLGALPEGFSKAFGLDRLSMAEPEGFYAVEVYLMVMLFGSLYAGILGAGILAKEEDDRTIEFLLARPVSRNRVLANKLAALLILLLVFNAGIGLTALSSFIVLDVGDYSVALLFRLILAPLAAHFTFAALGFFLALLFVRKKTATSVASGVVLGLYFVGTLSALSERLSWLRYFTPYYYVDAPGIVEKGIEPWKIGVLAGVTAVSVTASFLLYRRRDIAS